ncbi:hypothetical protein [Streptomyces sp. NPDC017435]|uniref:hypothetical protein n=1 Tax=Streptomyces sp. NPDC017435 TaxID=3364995 RepID=UPI0037A665AE
MVDDDTACFELLPKADRDVVQNGLLKVGKTPRGKSTPYTPWRWNISSSGHRRTNPRAVRARDRVVLLDPGSPAIKTRNGGCGIFSSNHYGAGTTVNIRKAVIKRNDFYS